MKLRHLAPALLLALAPNTFAASHLTASLTEGEVRRVDKSARKITIKHEAIKNLEMPPMTMAFAVKDGDMLERVKPGDKVRFSAEKIGTAFTVTRIETSK